MPEQDLGSVDCQLQDDILCKCRVSTLIIPVPQVYKTFSWSVDGDILISTLNNTVYIASSLLRGSESKTQALRSS